MDSNRLSCIYQKFSLHNNNSNNSSKKESNERMTSSRLKKRHLDLSTDSSLDFTSSSSDTDGEISKLREENRRLKRMAKHYSLQVLMLGKERDLSLNTPPDLSPKNIMGSNAMTSRPFRVKRRKYLITKERYKDVSNLNIELQKRFFEASPLQASYETPPSSMTYSMSQQPPPSSHPYPVMTQSPEEMMQQQQSHHTLDDSEPCHSPAMYSNNDESNPEEVEVKGHNMFVECISAQEPVCEISQHDESSDQMILSDEKLQAASCVRCGQAGDSLFVKNLAIAIWGAKTLSSRSVTGKRCMAIKDSIPKPPLSPRKVEFIKEKFIQRIQQNEPQVTPDEIGRRVQKIRSYIADKIATLNRRST